MRIELKCNSDYIFDRSYDSFGNLLGNGTDVLVSLKGDNLQLGYDGSEVLFEGDLDLLMELLKEVKEILMVPLKI